MFEIKNKMIVFLLTKTNRKARKIESFLKLQTKNQLVFSLDKKQAFTSIRVLKW